MVKVGFMYTIGTKHSLDSQATRQVGVAMEFDSLVIQFEYDFNV